MSERFDAGVECCEESVVHSDLVSLVREKLPAENDMQDLAELFKIFGDSTRIKILYLLFESEMCVCDIAELTGVTVSAVSHQLRVLKSAKLVKFRKEGKSVFYSLADEHVGSILAQGLEHIRE